jgi:hypothetical protein
VATAAAHGVSRTATALRLDYYALKRHVDAADNESVERASMSFVELPLPTSPPSRAIACAIEIAGREASRAVRIELESITVADLGALVANLTSPAA